MMLKQLQSILVTGGAGYVGTHFLEALLSDPVYQDHRIVVVDNLSTGHESLLRSLDPTGLKMVFEKADLLDLEHLKKLFHRYSPIAVLHFAAKISVAESVEKPMEYHRNNVEGSRNLLAAMNEVGCTNMVFSSTAAVYGATGDSVLVSELDLLKPTNPYGESKLAIELSIREASERGVLNAIVFRYFNASGASLSGKIGEWHEPETHLIPLLLESVLGQGDGLRVFGTDYPTRDGSCLRDYIHVSDLASAHILGLNRLLEGGVKGSEVYNLGTETGTTVLEVVKATEKVCGQKVRYAVYPRRNGDSASLVASNQKAKKVLGWNPQFSSIEMIIESAFRWQKRLIQLKSQEIPPQV